LATTAAKWISSMGGDPCLNVVDQPDLALSQVGYRLGEVFVAGQLIDALPAEHAQA
jgi:hypothetical protein